MHARIHVYSYLYLTLSFPILLHTYPAVLVFWGRSYRGLALIHRWSRPDATEDSSRGYRILLRTIQTLSPGLSCVHNNRFLGLTMKQLRVSCPQSTVALQNFGETLYPYINVAWLHGALIKLPYCRVRTMTDVCHCCNAILRHAYEAYAYLPTYFAVTLSMYTLIPTVYRALLKSAFSGTDHRIHTIKEPRFILAFLFSLLSRRAFLHPHSHI